MLIDNDGGHGGFTPRANSKRSGNARLRRRLRRIRERLFQASRSEEFNHLRTKQSALSSSVKDTDGELSAPAQKRLGDDASGVR